MHIMENKSYIKNKNSEAPLLAHFIQVSHTPNELRFFVFVKFKCHPYNIIDVSKHSINWKLHEYSKCLKLMDSTKTWIFQFLFNHCIFNLLIVYICVCFKFEMGKNKEKLLHPVKSQAESRVNFWSIFPPYIIWVKYISSWFLCLC